ncbi:CATRA conflict system CASPASE/TPR repeat-associated protein [Nonomuraea jabiensis]|uniref:CATRA conflict system CASPASE/TPR repeat-associated protein n=1 Tax=Nonomuraea jabiensis TaxID=882448 RepID=UPI003D7242DD
MKNSVLTDQELVVHLFAPVEGPLAAEAYEQVREIWSRCRERLGITVPIPSTGLLSTLPDALSLDGPDRALAAAEDPRVDYQVIARQIHDVLSVSMVFATPLEAARRAGRAGARMLNGWIEFDRWWEELVAGGTSALLGAARIYQAKCRKDQPVSALTDAVRVELPATGQRPGWSEHPHRHQDFVLWETGSGGDGRSERRFAVIAPDDQDAQLSAWTWSRGDAHVPPLARYLMHAAKLRYEIRVWDGGEPTGDLERETEKRVGRLRSLLRERPTDPLLLAELQQLRADMAGLTTAGTHLRKMRRTVEIAVDNMTRALGEPLPGDRELAEWFLEELDDADHYLDLTLSNAEGVQRIVQSMPPQESPRGPTAPARTPGRRTPGRVLVRMGFAVDIVDYSSRSSPQKTDLQERLAEMSEQVLEDMGIDIATTDRQPTGDGMNVFLPESLEPHTTLPRLLHAWRDRLARDNQRYSDRMRLRMAVVLGSVGVAALGYSGSTIVEVSRMLNSDLLRQAMRDRPAADLAVLISDPLYKYVVGEGYPGLDSSECERCSVESKGFETDAWLWTAR